MDITISKHKHDHHVEQTGFLLTLMEFHPLKCRYLHFQTTDIFLTPEFLTHGILALSWMVGVSNVLHVPLVYTIYRFGNEF